MSVSLYKVLPGQTKKNPTSGSNLVAVGRHTLFANRNQTDWQGEERGTHGFSVFDKTVDDLVWAWVGKGVHIIIIIDIIVAISS